MRDVFQCKVCGSRWTYGALCYWGVPPHLQPKPSEDEKCDDCRRWAQEYGAALRAVALRKKPREGK